MSVAQAMVFRGAGTPFEAVEIPLPSSLAPGEVLVRIRLATLCGSDLHTLDGRRHGPVPCVLGHEAVGIVEASARPRVEVGSRVTWTLADSCGCCAACAEWDLPQKCEQLFKYGHAGLDDGSGLNGCYASHIVLRPGTAVLMVPEALPDSWVAPANCALATIACALETVPKPCRTALVQGGGLLGIYAVAWLKALGVEKVFCADLSAERLASVEAFGGIPLQADLGSWAASKAKLMAATCLWLGATGSGMFLLWTGVMGGLFCLVLLFARFHSRPYLLGAPGWVVQLMEPRGDIPYGVAIAAGALMAYPGSPLLAAFIAG
jgi:D-arabinose 1-dehydrogenase-like Zn-dependent alcohol dehydrogenase